MPFIARTYSIVSPDSEGDSKQHGWADFAGNQFPIDHAKPETIHFDLATIGHDCTPDGYDTEEGKDEVDLAIAALRDAGATHASSSHFNAGTWYSAESDQDMQSGDDTTYSYHLHGFTLAQEGQVFRALTKR